MKDLVIEFLDSEFLVFAMYVYLFALVFYSVYSSINYFKYYSKVQKRIRSVYNRMSEQEKQRAQAERHERDIHGAGGKHDILAKIDEELAYSGLKVKYKWLTTEIYLIFVMIVTLLITTVFTVYYHWTIGIMAGILTAMTFKMIISALANSRERKTETIMIQFMNIVDNFSKTSDDLISILEKSANYLEEPLGTAVYDTVIEARNTGDSLTALQNLQDRVKNKHFKVLIRNLEISSRFESNYSEIIEDCREIFHDYLKSEKEKRSIRVNGMLEIVTMLICGFFCIAIIGDITEQGNVILTLLQGGLAGRAILAYIIFSVFAALYMAIFQILRNTK